MDALDTFRGLKITAAVIALVAFGVAIVDPLAIGAVNLGVVGLVFLTVATAAGIATLALDPERAIGTSRGRSG